MPSSIYGSRTKQNAITREKIYKLDRYYTRKCLSVEPSEQFLNPTSNL